MRICELCGKGSKKIISRSHSHGGTIRRQYPNLQTKRFGGVKMRLCTTCIKTMRKGALDGKARIVEP